MYIYISGDEVRARIRSVLDEDGGLTVQYASVLHRSTVRSPLPLSSPLSLLLLL